MPEPFTQVSPLGDCIRFALLMRRITTPLVSQSNTDVLSDRRSEVAQGPAVSESRCRQGPVREDLFPCLFQRWRPPPALGPWPPPTFKGSRARPSPPQAAVCQALLLIPVPLLQTLVRMLDPPGQSRHISPSPGSWLATGIPLPQTVYPQSQGHTAASMQSRRSS